MKRTPDAEIRHQLLREFLLDGAKEKQIVLDVGCGGGELMIDLARHGCSVMGVETDLSLVQFCRKQGLDVIEGRAEALPIVDESVDMIVCSVVIPYTDARQAVAEWARVLKPGGIINMTCHGIGYGLHCIIRQPGLIYRFYGVRMLLNTLFYRSTGRRLPGCLGDAMCQTTTQMKAYYSCNGLILERMQVVGRVAGAPLFLCHRLIKPMNSHQSGSNNRVANSYHDRPRQREIIACESGTNRAV
jgi:SAM-dependent methyltransferase